MAVDNNHLWLFAFVAFLLIAAFFIEGIKHPMSEANYNAINDILLQGAR